MLQVVEWANHAAVKETHTWCRSTFTPVWVTSLTVKVCTSDARGGNSSGKRDGRYMRRDPLVCSCVKSTDRASIRKVDVTV